MCDFAADAAAAEQLMVGRTLSVARVRELNAKDYFYQMLKDNPEMLKIYPGIENELLQGAIDCTSMPFRILSIVRGHDPDRHRGFECGARLPSKTIGTSVRLLPISPSGTSTI
jgi:hypothetical protein